MSHQITDMSFAQFAELLNNEKRVNFSNYASNKAALLATADDYIEAKRGNYATAYYFADVGGVDYIFMDEMAGVYPEVVAVVTGSSSKRTICEQFILDEYELWDSPDENYFAVIGSYGIKDSIVDVDESNYDGDVDILVQRHWSAQHRDMGADYILDDSWKGGAEYAEIESAKAYIKLLLDRDYILEPHEISRPTYVIVD